MNIYIFIYICPPLWIENNIVVVCIVQCQKLDNLSWELIHYKNMYKNTKWVSRLVSHFLNDISKGNIWFGQMLFREIWTLDGFWRHVFYSSSAAAVCLCRQQSTHCAGGAGYCQIYQRHPCIFHERYYFPPAGCITTIVLLNGSFGCNRNMTSLGISQELFIWC